MRVRVRSFGTKLLLVIMLTSGLAVLATSVTSVLSESIQVRESAVESLSTQADIVALSNVAPLSFDDRESAKEALSAFRANPSVLSAAVFDAKGRVFAHYERPGTLASAADDPPPAGHYIADGVLHLSRPITHRGESLGILHVHYDLAQAYGQLRNNIATSAAVGLLTALVCYVLGLRFRRVLTRPITELASVARRVSQERDYSLRARRYSNDELGDLTDAFNEMLEQVQLRDSALELARTELEQRVQERTQHLAEAVEQLEKQIVERERAEAERETLHQQLVETSRLAGMSEIATGVLHNVGNVLNSVNVSANLISSAVRHSRVAGLVKAADLIRQQGDNLPAFIADDQRGRQLPTYLCQLAEHLRGEQDQLLGELKCLNENVEHIREIVNVQQSYAKASGATQPIALTQMVEDALKTDDASLLRRGIEIVRQFEPVPRITSQKHKVLQVLVNLISNARHALSHVEGRPRRLVVRVGREGDSRVQVQVQDNGVGIRPEHMPRLFTHGFTTRPGGHGFGLHSSALAARELGGGLTVHSDGPDHGATFTLSLPVSLAEAKT
jgi:two-component system, NtrC family, sensor kinase